MEKSVRFTSNAWKFYNEQSAAVKKEFDRCIVTLSINGRMKVVEAPSAMQAILRRHKKNMMTDAKYRRSYDRLCERQARSLARDFKKGGKELETLRSIPGFKEEEGELRVKNAMQMAIYEAKRRSGLKQKEIAERMGIPASNVCRIEHSGDAITYKTFAAYLKACGFSFTLGLEQI